MSEEPLIVMGDFNTVAHQRNYTLLRQQLQDTWAGSGRGFGMTYPAQFRIGPIRTPLLRIDYIFHDDAWESGSITSGPAYDSDRQYLMADLYLRLTKP